MNSLFYFFIYLNPFEFPFYLFHFYFILFKLHFYFILYSRSFLKFNLNPLKIQLQLNDFHSINLARWGISLFFLTLEILFIIIITFFIQFIPKKSTTFFGYFANVFGKGENRGMKFLCLRKHKTELFALALTRLLTKIKYTFLLMFFSYKVFFLLKIGRLLKHGICIVLLLFRLLDFLRFFSSKYKR